MRKEKTNFTLAPVDLTFADAPVDLDFNDQTEGEIVHGKGKQPPAADALGLSRRLRIVTRTKHHARDLLGTSEALEHIITLPKPGESLHLICGGEHTALDLICATQRLLCRPITLVAATLSMNLSNAQRLLDMLATGEVLSIALVLSEFYAANDTDQFNVIKSRLEAAGQRIVATRNHAKVALIAAENPVARLVLEGSGNLRSCARIEQATLIHDAALYHFHHRWIDQLLQNQKL